MAPSITQLLIVLVIIVLLFGTKKLKNIGSDLGGALKGFKSSIKDDDEPENVDTKEIAGDVIEGEAEEVKPEDKVASKD